jgi:hypothetical protein
MEYWETGAQNLNSLPAEELDELALAALNATQESVAIEAPVQMGQDMWQTCGLSRRSSRLPYRHRRSPPIQGSASCSYSQGRGALSCVDVNTGKQMFSTKRYSGIGAGLNNPNAQSVPFVGPIPEGGSCVIG